MATKIIKNRKAAVAKAKAKGVDAATARKRNYVRTRSAELEAKGMKADKAALRKKFEAGEVSRKGFYAKGEGARKRKAAAATKSRGTKTKVQTKPKAPWNAPNFGSSSSSGRRSGPDGARGGY
jgi:hypothetical protein